MKVHLLAAAAVVLMSAAVALVVPADAATPSKGTPKQCGEWAGFVVNDWEHLTHDHLVLDGLPDHVVANGLDRYFRCVFAAQLKANPYGVTITGDGLVYFAEDNSVMCLPLAPCDDLRHVVYP